MIIVVFILICASSAWRLDQKLIKYNTTDERHYSRNATNNITEILMSYKEESTVLNNATGDLYNMTDIVPENETDYWTSEFGNITDILITTSKSPIDVEADNASSFNGKLSGLLYNNSQAGDSNNSNNSDNNKTEISTSNTQNLYSVTKETLYSEQILNQNRKNIPYHIHNDRVQTFTLDRKKITLSLQHHLQLVPMEDEPFGAMMFKDQRYLISVLIPTGIGLIGTAIVVCTIFSLRKAAKKRQVLTQLDDGTGVESPISPCISSIRTEPTDKVFLLLGDDQI